MIKYTNKYSKTEAFASKAEIEEVADDLISRFNPAARFAMWTNVKNNWGRCQFVDHQNIVKNQVREGRINFKARIILNTALLQEPKWQVVDTILHEIAHSIAGIEGRITRTGKYRRVMHGQRFRQACREIGANPRATHPSMAHMVTGSNAEAAHKQRAEAGRRTEPASSRQTLNMPIEKWNLVYIDSGKFFIAKTYRRRPNPKVFAQVEGGLIWLVGKPDSRFKLHLLTEQQVIAKLKEQV